MGDNTSYEEFDSIMELIITVIFMAFGIFATALMCSNMAKRVESSLLNDKITYTREDYNAANTYTFTGYQAYMFSWCMDELSYVPLYWLGADNGYIVSNSDLSSFIDTDTESNHWVKISSTDDSGNIRPMFITYRNRMIVGTGIGSNKSVKSVINQSAGTDNVSHFRGTNNIRYKLLLTGDYKSVNDLGNNPVKGGKTYQWILLPKAVP